VAGDRPTAPPSLGSRSRIFAHHDAVGVPGGNQRAHALAKPRSICCCTCIWLNELDHLERSRWCRRSPSIGASVFKARVHGGVLARAGGAGDEDDAVGLEASSLPALCRPRRSRAPEVAHQHFRVEMRNQPQLPRRTLWASWRGPSRSPFPLCRRGCASLCALLRAALLTTSIRAGSVMRAGHLAISTAAGSLHLVQHTVDPEAHEPCSRRRLEHGCRVARCSKSVLKLHIQSKTMRTMCACVGRRNCCLSAEARASCSKFASRRFRAVGPLLAPLIDFARVEKLHLVRAMVEGLAITLFECRG